jgi:2'-5' RNA ligase
MSEKPAFPSYQGQGALAIMLPVEVTGQIASWRARFDPYYRTIPPHITVMYPPFVHRAEWQAERTALARRLASFPAFELTLARTGAFLAPRHVLWLQPEDGGMIPLFEATVREHFGLPPAPPPYEFTPHVTLGFFDDEPALRQAEAEVMATLVPITFRVAAATYLFGQEDGTWQVGDHLPFERSEPRLGEVMP